MDENNNDAIAQRRRALAEALRTNGEVVVTPTGEVEFKEEAKDSDVPAKSVPRAKIIRTVVISNNSQ